MSKALTAPLDVRAKTFDSALHNPAPWPVLKIFVTLYPHPKVFGDPVTTLWSRSHPLIWCIWEWPPLGDELKWLLKVGGGKRIFGSCDFLSKICPPHMLLVTLFVCTCSDSAMPFLSCACLCNNSKWSFVRSILLQWKLNSHMMHWHTCIHTPIHYCGIRSFLGVHT